MLESFSVACLTFKYDVGHELHLYRYGSSTLTFLATSSLCIEGEVLVSGTCDYKIVERACEAIGKEKSTDLAFIPSESILTHEETIERCKQIKQVILIEKIGASNKQDVSSEVKRFEELGVQIIGIALNEQ